LVYWELNFEFLENWKTSNQEIFNGEDWNPGTGCTFGTGWELQAQRCGNTCVGVNGKSLKKGNFLHYFRSDCPMFPHKISFKLKARFCGRIKKYLVVLK